VTVAAAPSSIARLSTTAAGAPHGSDSVLVTAANRVADSTAAHEEAGGSVAPPPIASPRLSPMPAQTAPVTRRETPRVERHPVSIAEHARAAPAPSTRVAVSTAREHLAASRPSEQPPSAAQQPAVTPPSIAPPRLTAPVAAAAPAASSPVSSGAGSSPPAPTAAPANNAQFLEELRAIHAEIDARKKHMDSLTASLDSLKRIKP
jgi:hypothetical protein